MICYVSSYSPTTQQVLEPNHLRTVGEPEISLSRKDPSIGREMARLQPQPITPIISPIRYLAIRGYHTITQDKPLILTNINLLNQTLSIINRTGMCFN